MDMKYKKFLDDINAILLRINGKRLTLQQQKMARKLYNQRYSVDDAVGTLLTKI